MKKNGFNTNRPYSLLRFASVPPRITSVLSTLLLLAAAATSSRGTTSTWNGGSTLDSNWSDSTNWGGTVPVNGNALSFGGTARQTNTNDLVGLSIAGLNFSGANWDLEGTNAVTIASGSPTDNAVGTNIVGIPLILGHAIVATGNSYSDYLLINGVVSGTGTFGKTAGSAGVGTIALANTNNSFSGSVLVQAGRLIFYSMAPGGTNSSLGAGTSPIVIGYTGSSYQGTLEYDGLLSCMTDRGLTFVNALTLNANFTNNSPNNSSLTFGGPISAGSANPADVIPVDLGGSSSGTNTFLGPINTPGSINGSSINMSGPGTWVFDSVDYLTGNMSVGNNGHVMLGYTNAGPSSTILFQNITVGSGSTFDVSSFDQNGSEFVLGEYNGYPQSLIAGHTSGQVTDWNGSLSLAGNNGALGSALNVAGSGIPGTLAISSNLVTASGTIDFDLNTNNIVGSGSNDLIQVGENLDLSQGTASLAINAVHAVMATNVPYTLFTYGGSLIGNASGLGIISPSRAYSGQVSTATPGAVTVTFSPTGVSFANLIWSGNDSGNWDVHATPNWLNGGNSDYFYGGDNVTFNDSSSAGAINLVGTLSPGSITVSNNNTTYTFSTSSAGQISSGSLLKQGPGALIDNTADNFSGGTVISAGTILAEQANALGSGAITLGDTNSGTNAISLLYSQGLTVTNAIMVTSNGTGTVTIGCPLIGSGSTTLSTPILIQRGVTFTFNYTNNYLKLYGNIIGTGDVTFTSSTNGGYHSLGGTNVFGNIYITGAGTLLTTLTPIPTNSSVSVGAGAYLEPGLPQFACDALTGSGTVESYFGDAGAVTISLGDAGGSGTFSGNLTNNVLKAAANVIKLGSGTETFNGDNSPDTGSTIVSNGVFAVNNTSGYGLPVGGVTIAGGTLEGNGSIYSGTNTVVVNSVLLVGNAGDNSGTTFTITNTAGLFINSGGTLSARLFSGAGAGDNTGNAAAADTLNAECPITLTGATLTVGNPNSLSGWAAGDKWKIANWNSIPTGIFTTLNLPTLPSGLAWDTGNLYTSGVIDVVSNSNPTAAATITGVTLSGKNFIIAGTNLNGGQNFHYAVLVSTNLALPFGGWTPITTNPFNLDGSFTYTNMINPGSGPMFFDTKAVQ